MDRCWPIPSGRPGLKKVRCVRKQKGFLRNRPHRSYRLIDGVRCARHVPGLVAWGSGGRSGAIKRVFFGDREQGAAAFEMTGARPTARTHYNRDSPMAGLRERQKLSRRHNILASANKLFRSHGYLSTTIQKIADGAHVSHATVHNYYTSKFGILIALISNQTDELTYILEDHLSKNHADAKDSICEYLEVVTEHSLSNFDDEAWKLVHASLITNFDSDAAREFRGLRAQLQDGLSRLIVQLTEEKLLPEKSNSVLLADLFYKVHYFTYVNLVSDKEMTIADYRHRLRKAIGHVIDLLNTGHQEGDGARK